MLIRNGLKSSWCLPLPPIKPLRYWGHYLQDMGCWTKQYLTMVHNLLLRNLKHFANLMASVTQLVHPTILLPMVQSSVLFKLWRSLWSKQQVNQDPSKWCYPDSWWATVPFHIAQLEKHQPTCSLKDPSKPDWIYSNHIWQQGWTKGKSLR